MARGLRPLFDSLWRAGGRARSSSYDEDGNYEPGMPS